MDLIDRQAAIDAIKDFKQGAAEWRDEQEEGSDIWHRADSAIGTALEIGLRIKKLPSAQQNLKEAVETIRRFLDTGVFTATSEFVAADGRGLRTDWGYFEEGLDEIEKYLEWKGKEDE